jgi:hypothetical protein
MKLRSVVCLLAIISSGLLLALAKNRSSKIRVLIMDGFSNHDWKQSTPLLRGILDEAGGFEVNVSTMPGTGPRRGRIGGQTLPLTMW